MAMTTRTMNSAVQGNPEEAPAWDGDTVEIRFGGRLEDRRRLAREKVEDGVVLINGRVYRLIDWSAGAFSAGAFGPMVAKPSYIDCEITDRVDIKFSIHFPTKRIEFVGSAMIVRIDKERQELEASFTLLDEEAQIAIADHFGDDSMTGVAATASPATPRPKPAPAAPQQPVVRLAEEAPRAAGPTKIDLKYLTAADTRKSRKSSGRN